MMNTVVKVKLAQKHIPHEFGTHLLWWDTEHPSKGLHTGLIFMTTTGHFDNEIGLVIAGEADVPRGSKLALKMSDGRIFDIQKKKWTTMEDFIHPHSLNAVAA